MQNEKRYLVFLAVAGAHALALAVLIRGSREFGLPFTRVVPIEAFVILPASRRRAPGTPPRLDASPPPLAPLVEPITVPVPAIAPAGPGSRSIDWNAATRRAAAAMLRRRPAISFGFPTQVSPIMRGMPPPDRAAHHAGESDRTVSGEHIEWTSDHCYVASDPPVPGEPDFLARARVSRAGCLPKPAPDQSALFKSLPAYKRLHPP